ncbi:MAG: homogentisate phytyltransferase [Cryomorphaceae bacterium]|nr:homogentisate phytyltransferase [Cryomorphaceae bacterium]
MKLFSIAWRFSRPHTIIGSLLSTWSLYFMSAHPQAEVKNQIALFLLTLISAIGCNLYIVCLNQLTDIEIDKLNKPHLPLASGEISRSTARVIIAVSALVSVISAYSAGWLMFALVLIVGALGTAYSVPPLKFKKHHFGAAFSITLVRGVLVNILMFLHFQWEIAQTLEFPLYMLPLVLFMILFSIGIAWLKDIPDIKGDRNHGIETLAVNRGSRWVFRGAISLVSFSYLTLVLWGFVGLPGFNTVFLSFFHFVVWVLFLLGSLKANPFIKKDVKVFYRFYWVLFFVEYLFYPLGLVL